MGRIIDLPPLERPREKALRFGVEQLSDTELLACIIASGYKGVSALDLAHELISKHHGLLGLYDAANYKQKGIKDKKGLSLQAAFELHRRISKRESEKTSQKVDCDYLYNRYKSELLHQDQEQLILVIVNRYRHITYECTLYKGTENNVLFSYKDVWKELVVHKADAFYLVHNHPHMPKTPSKWDRILTGELLIECKKKGVPLLDHIVIGEDGYYSFKKEKIFDFSC